MTKDLPEITNRDISSGLEYLGWENTPAITNSYTDNQGLDGSVYDSTVFSRSVINARFLLHTSGHYNMQLARHDIYKIFGTKDLFRIRSDSSPAKVAFVRASSFDITPAKEGSKQALITIPFDNPSGYLYSLYPSDTPYLYSTNGWQLGMNLPNKENLSYSFNKNEFRVYNASDLKIDPYFQKHDLKITMTYEGDSLQLINKTNNSNWKITKELKRNEVVTLDGINTYINGKPASTYTDFGNITLDTGWNDIKVIGATYSNITFSFPFIYLD